MKYITGWIAFATPCELDTAGKWNLHKKDFLDEDNMTLYESEDSPFKHLGIEPGKPIEYHGNELFNVANHVRAYCDMLYQGKFAELKDIYAEVIDDPKALDLIFQLVDERLRSEKGFPIIDEFLTREFGNLWKSYVDTKASVAETLEKHRQELLSRGVEYT